MPRKSQKEKKKREKDANGMLQILTHSLDISKMFEKVSLLPPLTIAELDTIMKALHEKMELYSKPT
jgi:hypothetical protein